MGDPYAIVPSRPARPQGLSGGLLCHRALRVALIFRGFP
jgi:hypothetical protein